ncbi:malectin domain-containing carbohydrate-binding protein [Agaribacterium haliotis]|uniref:malectin domain-containing carbohydrate-binding protein n=1 Tax=Agaribacterium haliotis TaxID=2013869 RepID=UPI000BB5457C|nr:malectin domain-containing carbohydrate-binding protein [Agaribacterium haliotis]
MRSLPSIRRLALPALALVLSACGGAVDVDSAAPPSNPSDPQAGKPIAVISVTSLTDSEIQLDASKSYDPDNDTIVSYQWRVNGADYTTGMSATVPRDPALGYSIQLIVSDNANEGDAHKVFDAAHVELGDAERGKELYIDQCLGCHGVDGKATTNPIIDETKLSFGRNNRDIVSYFDLEMPLAPSLCSGQCAKDVAAYVRSWNDLIDLPAPKPSLAPSPSPSPTPSPIVPGQNQPPVAVIDVNIEPNNQMITVDGSKSYDPNGDALTYRWTVNSQDYGSNSSIQIIRQSNVSYSIQLQVSDNQYENTASEVVEATGVSLGDAVAGKTAYDNQCSSCHGAKGEGLNKLDSSKPTYGAHNTDIVTYIIEAMPIGTNPPTTCVGTCAADTAAYIRSWNTVVVPSPAPSAAPSSAPQPSTAPSSNPQPSTQPSANPQPSTQPSSAPQPSPSSNPTDPIVEAGKTQYEAQCLACHGVDGSKNADGTAAIFALDASKTSFAHSKEAGVQLSLEDYIVKWMPAVPGNCVGSCATEVAAYIKTWVDTPTPEPSVNPQPSPSPQPPQYETVVAINVAGAAFTAADGTRFSADSGFSGGSTSDQSASNADILNTTNDTLFYTERWGESTYEFDVDNGNYRVELGFVELVTTHSAGSRVFNVRVENQVRLQNVDPAGESGAVRTALNKVVDNISVSDGKLNLSFEKVTHNPTVSWIKVQRVSGGSTQPSPAPSPSSQPQQSPSSAPVPSPSSQPQVSPSPVVSPSPAPQPSPSSAPDPDLTPELQAGKDTYLSVCGTACHGDTGLGGEWGEIIDAIRNSHFDSDTVERMPLGNAAACDANCAASIRAWLEHEHDLNGSTPTPTPSPSPTTPPEPEETRYVSFLAVNVGGGDYTGIHGTEFKADYGFSGGGTSNQEGIIVSVPNTENDGLFFTERYGESTYEFDVPAGFYNVELGFVELVQTHTSAGARVFNVDIEGEQKLSNVDPVGETGSYHSALIKEAKDIWVADGKITIEMKSVTFNPTLSYINIKRAENTEDKYARMCSNCHGGPDGKGRSELGDALTASRCTTCGSRDSLVNFIERQMPFQFAHACVGDCATDMADYILDNFAGYQGRPDVELSDFLDKGGDLGACGTPDTGFNTLRRVAGVDYARMVSDLFKVEGDFTRGFSADQLVGNFFINSSRAPEFNQVKQYFEAATKVADAALLTKNEWMPSCAANDENCAVAVIDSIGRRAFRRPVSAAEQERLLTVFRAAQTAEDFDRGLSTMLQAILASPQFLYYVEQGEGQSAVRALTDYELAGRLALFLWRSVPDDVLLDLAANGQLSDDMVLTQQAERMLNDARAHEVVQLFHEQWMHVTEPSEGTNDYDEQYAALEDFRRTLNSLVFADNATYRELFTVDYGYLNDATKAFYEASGSPIASGSDGFDKYRVNADIRAGLLTRAPFLRSNHSPTTRGLFLREQVLCGVIPPAPPTIGEPDQSIPGLNPRELFKLHTEDPGCGGCHTLMDPLGFPLDNFDDSGHWQDMYGAGFPVDDSGYFLKTDVDGEFKGAQGLQSKLAASTDVQECYTYQWFQFAVGRTPNTNDTCSLGQANDAAYSQGGSIQDVIRSIVLSDAFRHRRANAQ